MTIERYAEDPHRVICDWCDEDWSDRADSGGFLFGSKAVCPTCVPRMMKGIEKHHEHHYIRGTCPDGMSFADWVRELRGPNPETVICTGEDAE